MLILRQFTIILFFYLLGEGISYLLPFSFPGSLIGMGLLFFALMSKLVKLEDINTVSHFFLKYMALFFIPAGVSVMTSYDLIKAELLPVVLVITLSTIFMLALISKLVDFFVRKVEDV